MKVKINRINRTENLGCESHVEDVEAETAGELYRALMGRFGRCESKMYVDDVHDNARHVGWVFVKREPYDDSPQEFFTCETWAGPVNEVPARALAIEIDALS